MEFVVCVLVCFLERLFVSQDVELHLKLCYQLRAIVALYLLQHFRLEVWHRHVTLKRTLQTGKIKKNNWLLENSTRFQRLTASLTIAVPPGGVGGDVVRTVVVVVHLVSGEPALFGMTVARLARLGSGQTDGTPASPSWHQLRRETLELLPAWHYHGGDVPQLWHLLVQLVALQVDGRLRVHTLDVSGLDLSVPYKPITTFLELLWSPGTSQAPGLPL